MATYAIGDIQGCYQSLRKLLRKIGYNSSEDKLWIAGDLINRGPNSLETLRYLFENRNSIQCVLGNHDLHFLAVEAGCRSANKKDTFEELLEASDRKSLVSWLKTLPLFHHDGALGFAMVHAGIPACWSLKQTSRYATEVSHCIQSGKATDFFRLMYGNQPESWDPASAGTARLRFITNALTRMRYCGQDGSLNLDCKLPLAEADKSLKPWFSMTRESLGADIVFGHWASLKGRCDVPGVHAIDTGCVWGGSLTALRLEDKKKFSVKSAEITNT